MRRRLLLSDLSAGKGRGGEVRLGQGARMGVKCRFHPSLLMQLSSYA